MKLVSPSGAMRSIMAFDCGFMSEAPSGATLCQLTSLNPAFNSGPSPKVVSSDRVLVSQVCSTMLAMSSASFPFRAN